MQPHDQSQPERKCIKVMELLRTQFRQNLRRLGRTPIFTAVTVLTVAVSIGVTTAIFSVIECVLLKPLPYPHPEELVAVEFTVQG
jgi:putative ABC transport system permease protein